MAVNRNELAEVVTKKEGLKKSVNIGQVKEIQRLTFIELTNYYEFSEIIAMLEKYIEYDE